ncbi:hypothetical protein F5050DRAFT_940799 [Lentinula boryana]|uniref:Uncharacterized protein n=1 Tax=Lentinula boryana TaxID=40481 RepID=A0ABQ8Q140_9AGAR|nr:hypothetical protein F5050DRAFT_940799 [Lentinula boryana]
MRLLNLALFVTWLVSLAYAVPMPRQASTIAIRSDRMQVTKVEVKYNPDDLPSPIKDGATGMMKDAITSALRGSFREPDSAAFSFTTGETKEKYRADFTFEAVKANGNEKNYKGGQVMIDTNKMFVTKLHS